MGRLRARLPDFVPELRKLLLVGWIKLELRLGFYQNAGLKTATSKHDGRLDMGILVQHAFYVAMSASLIADSDYPVPSGPGFVCKTIRMVIKQVHTLVKYTYLLAGTVYDLVIEPSEDLPQARSSRMRHEKVRGGVSVHAVDLCVDDVGLATF